jgi:polyribonucleotide nucleotidyltransferase
VPKESIKKIIGPKGITINNLIETYNLTNIHIADDDMSVQIESNSPTSNQLAKEAIDKIILDLESSNSKPEDLDDTNKVEEDKEPQEGLIYRNCEIVSVTQFGVFVQLLPRHQALVHISELDTKRVSINYSIMYIYVICQSYVSYILTCRL